LRPARISGHALAEGREIAYGHLKPNPEARLTLSIQKDSQGADRESNWLPAPAGKFILMAAHVLAKRNRFTDHRRHLDDPASQKSELIVVGWRK
jgi:hypothetical protein